MATMPPDFTTFNQAPPKKSNKKMIIIIILVVVLLCLICCGGLVAMPFLGLYMVKGSVESSAKQALVQSPEAKEALGEVTNVAFGFEATGQAVNKHQGEPNWFGCDVDGSEAPGDIYVHLGQDMKTVLEAELVLEDGTVIPLTGAAGPSLEIEAPGATTMEPAETAEPVAP